MVETLTVNLGSRSYQLHFGADLTAQVRAEIDGLRRAGRPVGLIIDGTVAEQHLAKVAAMFGEVPQITVPGGESSKCYGQLQRLHDWLARRKIDRSGAVFVVGGGVVGDLAGFAAATFLRGLPFYQIPTTLLAMVDSSVGGKTGINLAAGKNLVGAFHQPRAVFIDTGLLATLPEREFAAGAGEILKYGLLGDPELWARLEPRPLTPESDDLAAVVRRCCALKAKIVEADEYETAAEGGRALLNLGHTFGHAIEAATGYTIYLHGEAVAIGLVAAAEMSQRFGYITSADVERIALTVAAHGLPPRLREVLPVDALLSAAARDKKVRAGRLRFVVLRGIGEAATEDDVLPELAAECFRAIGAV